MLGSNYIIIYVFKITLNLKSAMLEDREKIIILYFIYRFYVWIKSATEFIMTYNFIIYLNHQKKNDFLCVLSLIKLILRPISLSTHSN